MIPRTILPKLLAEVEKPFVSVLIGPRQVGKTVLLRMLEEKLEAKCTYVDAEDPFDSDLLKDGARSLVAHLGEGPQVLLLDEFHRIPDALALFKQLRDSFPLYKVYASGSSSIKIHSHLKQSAVGRVRRTRVFPLSFVEWSQPRLDLELANWAIDKPLAPRTAARCSNLLEEFLVWGGMPELTTTSKELERREILHEIVGLYLEKDVASLLRKDELMKFNEFLRLVAVRCGQQLNKSRFGGRLGISARQVERQLLVMEHTFVLRLTGTDYANPTKRLVKAPKMYLYDNGVRNALVRDFRLRALRPDAGALVESHVLGELEKAIDVSVDICFHRTADGQEVDFVLERDRLKILVEVKSGLVRPRIPPAISDLSRREDVVASVVLNDGLHQAVDCSGKPVHFLPHYLAHRIPSLFAQT